MNPNNDFLSQKDSNIVKGKKPVKDDKPKPTKDDLKKYAEYYAMSEYSRRTLASVNYFRVLYGIGEIPVPESDTHYKMYFDKRCYERAENYQKLMKTGGTFHSYLDKDGKPLHKEGNSSKSINFENSKQLMDVSEELIEQEPEIKKEPEFRTPEENKLLREQLAKFEVENNNSPVKKEVKSKPKKDKPTDNSQSSLF